jgi:hypothetical protein
VFAVHLRRPSWASFIARFSPGFGTQTAFRDAFAFSWHWVAPSNLLGTGGNLASASGPFLLEAQSLGHRSTVAQKFAVKLTCSLSADIASRQYLSGDSVSEDLSGPDHYMSG